LITGIGDVIDAEWLALIEAVKIAQEEKLTDIAVTRKA
jgi:hypothetical protein